MPAYGYNPVQGVALNQGATFNTVIGCNKGLVLHEDGSGIIIMRGIVDCPCQGFARYKVTAISNIALPDGATVVPIAVALSVNGETRPTSRAIVTPAAVGDYFNVTCSDFIDVPKGCCFSLSIRNVPASEDPTYTPAPLINTQNLNITVDKVLL